MDIFMRKNVESQCFQVVEVEEVAGAFPIEEGLSQVGDDFGIAFRRNGMSIRELQ